MNVPKLRFPEFTEEWVFKNGDDIFIPISDKDHESDLPILAISQEFGAIPRDMIDYKISVTNESISSYKVVQVGDFIISLRSFQGGIEYSEYKGICSPAYIILRPQIAIHDYFFKFYLKTPKYILKLQSKLEGIRDGKMISYKYFSEIKLPYPRIPEQQKIASFLTTVDEKNRLLKQKKELLEEYKKGVMQQIFSRKLRFRDENGEEFPDWEKQKLKEVFLRKTTKNKDNHISTVLTNSATKGIVLQEDYFDRDIANNENLQGYYIVELDDFVYNPRISATAPVGPLKRNKTSIGVMSPLYTILKPQKGSLSFFEHYFSASLWHKYMFGIANYGARHDRMNITIEDFENMPLPFPSHKEQQKIASFLTALDDKIGAIGAQIEGMEAWKKGLLQRMFV